MPVRYSNYTDIKAQCTHGMKIALALNVNMEYQAAPSFIKQYALIESCTILLVKFSIMSITVKYGCSSGTVLKSVWVNSEQFAVELKCNAVKLQKMLSIGFLSMT